MHKPLLATFAAVAMVGPALAMSPPVRDCHPYWVVMTCDVDMPSCSRPHMTYQRGQGVADSPYGNYLYYTPPYETHCGHGCGHHHHARHVSAMHHSAHHAHRGQHHGWTRLRPPAFYYGCTPCGHAHIWWPAN